MKNQIQNLSFAFIILALVLISCKDTATKVGEEKVEQNSGQQVAQSTITLLSPNDFSKRIDVVGDIQLIDVRTSQEVATGSIPGAHNIDIMDAEFEDKVAHFDKSKPVFVYCKSGGRSKRAAGILKSAGFSEIYDLNGGITAWKSAGLQIVQ